MGKGKEEKDKPIKKLSERTKKENEDIRRDAGLKGHQTRKARKAARDQREEEIRREHGQ